MSDLDGDGILETPSEILQEKHFYPFGMAMEGPWMESSANPVNKYQYNGKELHTEFGLNLMDYGARWYDAAVGRWWSVDPLADRMIVESPYNYVFNNPMKFIDPNGKSGIPSIDGNTITISSHFYIYGSKSKEYAKQAIDNISSQWNGANGTRKIDGKTYNINFNITYEVVSDKQASIEAQFNKTPLNNFMRIEEGGGSRTGAASSNGGNSFYLDTGQLEEGSTTPAHEYGHGLGLLFHDSSGELVEGQPGIMTTLHTLVQAPYTENPSLGDSKLLPSGEGEFKIQNPLNTHTRIVNQKDIERIFLYLRGDIVGDIDNKLYNKDGKKVKKKRRD